MSAKIAATFLFLIVTGAHAHAADRACKQLMENFYRNVDYKGTLDNRATGVIVETGKTPDGKATVTYRSNGRNDRTGELIYSHEMTEVLGAKDKPTEVTISDASFFPVNEKGELDTKGKKLAVTKMNVQVFDIADDCTIKMIKVGNKYPHDDPKSKASTFEVNGPFCDVTDFGLVIASKTSKVPPKIPEELMAVIKKYQLIKTEKDQPISTGKVLGLILSADEICRDYGKYLSRTRKVEIKGADIQPAQGAGSGN